MSLRVLFLLCSLLGALGVFLLFILLPGVDFGLGRNCESFLLVGGFAVLVVSNGLLVVIDVVPGGILRHDFNIFSIMVDISVVSLVLVTPLNEPFV